MDVSIMVPDDVARQLEATWDNVPQRALEALALEAYRTGVLTEAEVQRMLGFLSRWEVEEFLKRSHAYLDYTEADLEQDIEAIRGFASR
ncbi:MAG: UPF0175 family protein [Anaerolineae bacterium]|nr:UPF0175 family protein [Anaerolineae bacterium]